VAEGIAALDHELGNDAVKNQSVVELLSLDGLSRLWVCVRLLAQRQAYDGAHGERRLFFKELAGERPLVGVKRHVETRLAVACRHSVFLHWFLRSLIPLPCPLTAAGSVPGRLGRRLRLCLGAPWGAASFAEPRSPRSQCCPASGTPCPGRPCPHSGCDSDPDPVPKARLLHNRHRADRQHPYLQPPRRRVRSRTYRERCCPRG